MDEKFIFMELKKTIYLYAVLAEENSSHYSITAVSSDMSDYPNWVYLDSQEVVFDEPASDYVEEMIEQRIKENRIKELDEARKRLAELEGRDNG